MNRNSKKIKKSFIHIGQRKTISTKGLIAVFSRDSILVNLENNGALPDLFDEEEKRFFSDIKSLFFYEDGYIVSSKIKSISLIKRLHNNIFQRIEKHSEGSL